LVRDRILERGTSDSDKWTVVEEDMSRRVRKPPYGGAKAIQTEIPSRVGEAHDEKTPPTVLIGLRKRSAKGQILTNSDDVCHIGSFYLQGNVREETGLLCERFVKIERGKKVLQIPSKGKRPSGEDSKLTGAGAGGAPRPTHRRRAKTIRATTERKLLRWLLPRMGEAGEGGPSPPSGRKKRGEASTGGDVHPSCQKKDLSILWRPLGGYQQYESILLDLRRVEKSLARGGEIVI